MDLTEGRSENPDSSWKTIHARLRLALFYPRPVVGDPVGDRLVVALEGSPGRALAGPAQPAAQQLPGLGLSEPHAGGRLNHIGHPGQCPQVGREAVRPRPLLQRSHDVAELLVVDAGEPSRPTSTTQRRPPASTPRLIPARRRLSRHAQRVGDLGLGLAPAEHVRGPQPPRLERREVSSRTNRIDPNSVVRDSDLGGSRHPTIISQPRNYITVVHACPAAHTTTFAVARCGRY